MRVGGKELGNGIEIEKVNLSTFNRVRMIQIMAVYMAVPGALAALSGNTDVNINTVEFFRYPFGHRDKLIELFPDEKGLRGGDLEFLKGTALLIGEGLGRVGNVFGGMSDGLKNPQYDERDKRKYQAKKEAGGRLHDKDDYRKGFLDFAKTNPESVLFIDNAIGEKAMRVGEGAVSVLQSWMRHLGVADRNDLSAAEMSVEQMRASVEVREKTFNYFLSLGRFGLTAEEIEFLYGDLFVGLAFSSFLRSSGIRGMLSLPAGIFAELETAFYYQKYGFEVELGWKSFDDAYGVDLRVYGEKDDCRLVQVKGERNMTEIEYFNLGDKENLTSLQQRLALISSQRQGKRALSTLSALQIQACEEGVMAEWCFAPSDYERIYSELSDKLGIEDIKTLRVTGGFEI